MMKIVYIAHPVSGDIPGNLKKIIEIVRHLNKTRTDIVPFAHYWVDCHALNDDLPDERARGIDNDTVFFKRRVFDELWLFGDKISRGMTAEIELAHMLNIPVVPMSDETKKLYKPL